MLQSNRKGGPARGAKKPRQETRAFVPEDPKPGAYVAVGVKAQAQPRPLPQPKLEHSSLDGLSQAIVGPTPRPESARPPRLPPSTPPRPAPSSPPRLPALAHTVPAREHPTLLHKHTSVDSHEITDPNVSIIEVMESVARPMSSPPPLPRRDLRSSPNKRTAWTVVALAWAAMISLALLAPDSQKHPHGKLTATPMMPRPAAIAASLASGPNKAVMPAPVKAPPIVTVSAPATVESHSPDKAVAEPEAPSASPEPKVSPAAIEASPVKQAVRSSKLRSKRKVAHAKRVKRVKKHRRSHVRNAHRS